MVRYLYLGKYSTEGLKGLAAEGGTKRREATGQLVESLGGRMTEYAFAVGEYDFIVIAEMPDDTAALVPSIMAGSTGTVRVLTVPLRSPAEIDAVSARIAEATFRAAGHS
jgi:uncharacterized protein with GYD domain